jgi:hypothetical protein
MPFIHNISTVARYEARTLRRSWFFRLFSLGALFIFTFMNIGLFSPIGDEDWEIISIPAAIPLINLYLLNIGQAIVVIFLAADFLKRDKKLDTNEVLYTRSMSNFEYVIGKTWGILRLFLGLDIIILAIAMLINIISKSMSVDIVAYGSYLLIISLPTILFSLGFAFLMMSVIKNQAVTFLLLLGIAALDMFFLWYRFGSIFDYMAFGVPVFKSGLVGFDNLRLIMNQRLLYLFLGASLVLAAVLLFKRLPQSKSHTYIASVLMVLFTAGAAVCAFNVYLDYAEGIKIKETVIETNRKFENRLFATILDAKISIEHSGKSIRATSEVIIRNDNKESLKGYVFSLNPYLEVSGTSSGGNELKFSRTGHVLDIVPQKELGKGETDTVTIEYSGSINESFCYPDYSDNLKDNPYRIAMLNVSKRQAFLESNYVLLTPETHWYPVTSLNYYPTNPARIKIDFSKYTLKVKDEDGLISVSQGVKKNEAGFSVFSPENPLTGITLAIGNYEPDTLTVDSIDYITYHFPGNDYYKKDLSELKDTLGNMVSGIMRDLETNFSTKYPFRSLTLIEVPVQFHSYPRESTQTRSEVQPSMVLLPERLSTLQNAGFAKQFSRQKKRMARNNTVITDKELQVRIFNNFTRNAFISGENFRFVNGVAVNEPVRYRLGPSFYYFKNNFFSSEYPVINAVFESHLQKVSQPTSPGGGNISEELTDNDRANLVLRDRSFRDLLAMHPKGDTIRTIVTVKGDWFFNLLRSKAGINEFNTWFSKYINAHKFQSVDLLNFNNDVNDKFGFEFYPYLGEWFTGSQQPGFSFGELRVNEIVVGDRSRFQVTFTASNSEKASGIFNVSFRSGRGGGGNQLMGGGREGMSIAMQGRGMDASDVSKIITLTPGEAKRVGIVLDYQPRAMMINTLISKNIPGQITLPVEEVIKVKGSSKPFEGEEVVPLPDYTEKSELIVDNEDSGFSSGLKPSAAPLRKMLGLNKNEEISYQTINMWWAPEYWQPVIASTYYGKYVLSSVYTRSGKGERSVIWKTPIKAPGYYDVYCWVGKAVNRMSFRGANGQRGGGPGMQGGPAMEQGGRKAEVLYKDMHYKVFHDEGIEDVTVDYENAEGGWNNLGRYYFSKDSAKVELTNQSSGRMVIGDAIRWVRQE